MTANTRNNVTNVKGAGVGLRPQHISEVLATRPKIPWFEILIDNFLEAGPRQLEQLEQICDLYPVTFHSVSFNIGSPDQLDNKFLKNLKIFIDRYRPAAVSDHLCWTAVDGRHHHDLLPLRFDDETVKQCAVKILQIQEQLGVSLAVENVSSYLQVDNATMTEWEFVNSVSKEAGCSILLDVNNIFVNSRNFGFNPKTYIESIAADRVSQYHLAGYEEHPEYLLDAHCSPVSEEVWQLFEYAVKTVGVKPTLIEWDNDIPTFDVLKSEALKAEEYLGSFDG